MGLKDPMKWYVRMSAVYALGVWTMIGSVAYLKYTGRLDDAKVTKDDEETEDPYKVVYKTAHTKTIVTYKEGPVSYNRMMYNFVRSYSGWPGSGDE